MRTRASAIVIRDNQLLAIHRHRDGEEYFVFPGGGVDDGETTEQAAIRELAEETSITGEIIKLGHHLTRVGDVDNWYYLCRYIDGIPQLGNFNEQAKTDIDSTDTYEPLWLDADNLPEKLYPAVIRTWLVEELATNFASAPVELVIQP